jgi:CelD/BcsL family acetyltransferase involved in cellulose biosynthesis
MRIELSEDGRDFLRRDWTDLVQADPAATFFHTPRYLKLYWEEFGQEAPLLLAFVEEDDRTVGVAAFEGSGTTLRFLGGTEVTDYMGPVAMPGTEDAVAKELMGALVSREDWIDADLRGLPEDSPWLQRLQDAASGAGLDTSVEEDSVAPFLQLPATFDEYLAALPSKLRHEIRRKHRKLEAGAEWHALRYSTPETVGADLDRFVALHRASEGPKGMFMVPGMEIFFRHLAEDFLQERIFRLAFLQAEGADMAAAIGFAFHDRFYLYNSAFDRQWQQLAPGMLLVSHLIEDAIAGGCSGFDMLKGDLEYKYRFGATPRPVKRLVLTRR